MLYPTTTIASDSRDQDGMYALDSGCQLVFPFTVPYLGQQIITIKHAMTNAEDWSINCAFVKGPKAEPVAVSSDNILDFRVDRSDMTFEFWGEGGGPEGAIELDPTQTYYLYALNLQNKSNGILVTFSV